MKAADEIKRSILSYLSCLDADDHARVVDLLDSYSDSAAEDRVVGRVLREMRREGAVRLVAAGDRSRTDPAELDRCTAALDSDNETFVLVALA